VTAFEADEQLVLAANPNGAVNYSELQHYLNGQLSEKTMHAVKMVANCSYCEVRSPQKQTIPYPPLHTALEDQSVYELYNVTGTFVGFFSPNDSNQVFVPGWHFHFLSAERTRGGHVLDASIRSATIQVDDESTAVVRLLGDAAFWGLPLTPNFS
jgi:acetolactate decarboxylase